jgi:energy-coupling factor transporter ATP-binding protein EcfA2
MQNIKIDHLGPIRNSGKIELNQTNLLIGEQASGKSTFCKAVYCFREFQTQALSDLYSMILYHTYESSDVIYELKKTMRSRFEALLGPKSALPEDLDVTFWYTEENWIRIRITAHSKYPLIFFSDNLTTEIQSALEEIKEASGQVNRTDLPKAAASILDDRIYRMLVQKTEQIFGDCMETFYIPAGRAMISLLSHQKTRLDYGSLDPVNVQYMREMESLQKEYSDGISHLAEQYPEQNRGFDANELVHRIRDGLQGEYVIRNGQEYLIPAGAETELVPIENTSSGQQEVLWIYQQLYYMILRKKKAFVIIEEPESHLYPTMQKDILDFIVTYQHLTGGSVLVTTHSPYLLTETNNLCYAGRLRKTRKADVVQLMGEYGYLDEEKLNALRFNRKSGKIENLMQDHEILAERIDEVSDEINRIYTRLYDLDEGLE